MPKPIKLNWVYTNKEVKNIARHIPYFFIVFLRIFIPIVFFKNHSVYLVISMIVLDLYDADFAANGVLTKEWYQKMDKLLDFWWYVWILTYVLEHYYYAAALFIILFIYRMIGQILVMSGEDRRILFFFPNLYETFFFLFFFSLNIYPLHFLIEGRMLYFSLALVILFKFFNEYFIHVADRSVRKILFGSERHWGEGNG